MRLVLDKQSHASQLRFPCPAARGDRAGGARGRASSRLAAAARAPRRRLFTADDPEGHGSNPEDKYADWIEEDEGQQGSPSPPSPASPRSGFDPSLSPEERSAALAMLQRSGLMSISAIREAYLQRIAQDLQEASASGAGPRPQPGLLWGELAKLEEELGEGLEADWSDAEGVLTTTGRANKQGAAAKLMPRPQHPGGIDPDDKRGLGLKRPAWSGSRSSGDDYDEPTLDGAMAEEEAPMDIGDSRLLDRIAESVGLPGLSSSAREAADQQRRNRDFVIAARRRLAAAQDAAARARRGGGGAGLGAAPRPLGAPPAVAPQGPAPPPPAAAAAALPPAAPRAPPLFGGQRPPSLEQLIVQKQAEKAGGQRRAPASPDRIAEAKAKLRAVGLAGAEGTKSASAKLSGELRPLVRPRLARPGGASLGNSEEPWDGGEEAVGPAMSKDEFGADYWRSLAGAMGAAAAGASGGSGGGAGPGGRQWPPRLQKEQAEILARASKRMAASPAPARPALPGQAAAGPGGAAAAAAGGGGAARPAGYAEDEAADADGFDVDYWRGLAESMGGAAGQPAPAPGKRAALPPPPRLPQAQQEVLRLASLKASALSAGPVVRPARPGEAAGSRGPAQQQQEEEGDGGDEPWVDEDAEDVDQDEFDSNYWLGMAESMGGAAGQPAPAPGKHAAATPPPPPPPRLLREQQEVLRLASLKASALPARPVVRPARPGEAAGSRGPAHQQQQQQQQQEGDDGDEPWVDEDAEDVNQDEFDSDYWLGMAESLGGGSSSNPGKDGIHRPRRQQEQQRQEEGKAQLDALQRASERLQRLAAAPAAAAAARLARPGAPTGTGAAQQQQEQQQQRALKQQRPGQGPGHGRGRGRALGQQQGNSLENGQQQQQQQQQRLQGQKQQGQQQQKQQGQQQQQKQQRKDPQQNGVEQGPPKPLSGEQTAAADRIGVSLGGSRLRRPPARPQAE